ncbi:hypothetical protein AJ78_04693 [Emergomyces pasteurianus Ep9510]|uniref:K Homology domain-containing protein n=1 Tax=Emergomyces pasteurianus Ep9510 TaxID=1447872 RepID=A0A1J9PER1_9EURO|nr:hypothetical protein AJ78_04693 [Emergomyces pasteurianus Ep9510]
MTSSSPLFVLPGDPISYPLQHPSQSTTTKLSSGLRLLETPANKNNTSLITATQAGLLTTDPKRNTLTLHTFPRRRYIPSPNDLLIAQIHHSSADYFHCIITPHTPHAFLGQLAFEGATRKTRPLLKHGDLVYARVLSTGVGNAGGEVELTCVNPATGKSGPEGLGPLVGGMLFDVSTGFAERLMMRGGSEGGSGVVVLEELGRKLESQGGFEVAVGKNGRVWVDCSAARKGGGGDADTAKAVKTTVAVGRCLRETDEKDLGLAEQRKLIGRVLREVGLGS